ncbi:MAG: phosphoribosylaminoimidazolesuccinocarboxamide synthase [Dehalococcoidia bacterium]
MTDNTPVLLKTELPLPRFVKGKVRDSYDLGDKLLIVATDRISAFDVVLPCGIPNKGKVLNKLSAFWFNQTKEFMPNHMIEPIEDAAALTPYLPDGKRFAPPVYLVGRSMVVKKVKRIMIECVVRGYLSGSAWAEYREKGTISGMKAPSGLKESQELSQPMFTPTTKAEEGHDMPMSRKEMVKMVGESLADELEEKSLAIYNYGRGYAMARGIIIADTKFEFGLDGDKLVIIDEMLTPDSSRIWEVDLYKVGQPQPSFDKQPVRDWLAASGWDKTPPAPMLPEDVIEATAKRYERAYRRLTDQKL